MFNPTVKVTKTIGSKGAWLFLRIGSFIAIVIAIWFCWVPPTSIALVTTSVVLIAYACYFFNGFAYGVANEKGLRYRRYFRWQECSWDDIVHVGSAYANCTELVVKGRSFLACRLVFIDNPKLSSLVKGQGLTALLKAELKENSRTLDRDNPQ